MNALVLDLATAASLTGWTATTAAALRLFRHLHTDPLTGLGNRAALTRLQRRHRSSSRPVGVLLADLDRFKAINDTHGHDHGNRVLAAVAVRLADAVQPGEYPIRLHGDEFAIWLGPTTTAHAERRAAEITTALARPLLLDQRPVTAAGSVGAACLPGRDGLAALLAAADHAMYAAKTARRITGLPTQPNRVRDQHATA